MQILSDVFTYFIVVIIIIITFISDTTVHMTYFAHNIFCFTPGNAMTGARCTLRTLFFETYALDCRTLKLTFYKIVIGLKFHTGCADWWSRAALCRLIVGTSSIIVSIAIEAWPKGALLRVPSDGCWNVYTYGTHTLFLSRGSMLK